MEGDSDEGNEVTDSDAWTSAALEHGWAMEMTIEHHEERHRIAVEWVSTM